MRITRRGFLKLTQAAAVAAVIGPGQTLAQGGIWRVRRARPADAAELARVFNAHLKAGICPYRELIDPWTEEFAAGMLTLHNGTLVLFQNEVAVAFVMLIDFSDPKTHEHARIAAGRDPEIRAVALDFERLTAGETVNAAKHLAAAAARELRRMGFEGCRMRLPVQSILGSSEWLETNAKVLRIRDRGGVPHAREVRLDVAQVLASLTSEGF